MDTKSFFLTIFIASALLAPTALRSEVKCSDPLHAFVNEAAPQQANPKPSPAPSPKQSGDSALYGDGTRAIDEGRWADAEAIFSKVAAMHGEYAEGALYWKAYAQNKLGQPARALETCASLRQAYPHSRWLDECGALEIEIRGRAGHVPDPQSQGDDELKMYALWAVMQQDEARAVPIIQKILTGNSSDHLKEKALFILSQGHTKEAQDLLGQTARGQSNPALQIRAIRVLATRGKQSNDILADIYQHTSDVNVKKAVLQSYLVSGSKDKLLDAARSEKDPQLVHTAVQQLGAMGATSELLDLYRSTSSVEAKASIIGALIASGHKGADALGAIANIEKDPELRSKAIRNLGIAGGASAAPAIVSAYQSTTDAGTKKAAIDALFISGDAHDLVSLARSETHPEFKHEIISKLAIMHNKEATDYMLEILSK
ncbi:MAG TPA: HEAT repeat domain-containing protein [Edaphobacter sp.]